MTEPHKWKIRPFVDIGSSELFVSRIILGLPDVLGGTLYTNRDEIQEGIAALGMECLMPAFLSLRELRKTASDEEIPILKKRKNFDDMCKSLWTAYKDRMAGVAQLMGYDIGFLFQRDRLFGEGCADFLRANPGVNPELIRLMEFNRTNWQRELATFRNDYLEHQKIKAKDIASFYSLERAEMLFKDVWTSIEEILVLLMAAKLPPGIGLREIPEAERDPGSPKRFGWVWVNPPQS